MVTVYADNGKTVNVTHYCAMGNQPQMALKKAADNRWDFEMVGTKGISNKNESHMHAITLTLNGNNLKQEWTNTRTGKKTKPLRLNLRKSCSVSLLAKPLKS